MMTTIFIVCIIHLRLTKLPQIPEEDMIHIYIQSVHIDSWNTIKPTVSFSIHRRSPSSNPLSDHLPASPSPPPCVFLAADCPDYAGIRRDAPGCRTDGMWNAGIRRSWGRPDWREGEREMGEWRHSRGPSINYVMHRGVGGCYDKCNKLL